MWGTRSGLQRLLGIGIVATLLLGGTLPVRQLKLHDVLISLQLVIYIRPCVDRDMDTSTAMLGAAGGVKGWRDDVGARR